MDIQLPTEAPDDKDVPQEDTQVETQNAYHDDEQRAWDEHKDECNGCALCEV